MSRRTPQTPIAPSLSPDSSLSSALSFESAHGLNEAAAQPVKNTTNAAAGEDVKLETTNSRRGSQKRGAVEPLVGIPATKKRKTPKAVVVEKETLNEETATIIVERVRRSRKTTETTRKASTNGAGQASNKTKIEEEEKVTAEQEDTPKRTKRITKVKVETAEDEKEKEEEKVATPKKSRKRTKKETGEVKQEVEEVGEEGEDPRKTKRRRKTKEEKEAEAMPLAARSTGLRMFLGAHVSSAKGVHNSVTNCVHIGGNAFALFLKSQRKWENPPLQDSHRDQFRASCLEHNYDATSHILPHGSYLVNLAQADPPKAQQAYSAFLDDLHRCEALGIKLYNFHPGTTGPHPRPAAISRIASALNRALAATKTVKPVLENMAGANTVIGSTFEDLRDIIALVDDKTRIGVCLDTCHAFAAGYDLRTPAAFAGTMDEFDRVVGLEYLSALHVNDSKAPMGSHRDVHQNIGLGFLGLRAFWNVMNEGRFEGLPMVLETPIERVDGEGRTVEDKGVWAGEIKLLEGLVGMDVRGEEFLGLERELADRGREERGRYLEAHERKVAKEKGGVKGKRKTKRMGEEAEAVEDSGSELEDI